MEEHEQTGAFDSSLAVKQVIPGCNVAMNSGTGEADLRMPVPGFLEIWK